MNRNTPTHNPNKKPPRPRVTPVLTEEQRALHAIESIAASLRTIAHHIAKADDHAQAAAH